MSFQHRNTKDSILLNNGIKVSNDKNKSVLSKSKKIHYINPCLNDINIVSNSSTDLNAIEKIKSCNDKRVLNRSEAPRKRVCTESVGDFWSRVDSREIDISFNLLENKHISVLNLNKYKINIDNYNIITTNVSDYSYKSTPFGDVYYSPRFQDDKYIYRYVILTKGVRNEAYRILKNSKSFLLTEHQIIRELCIDLSPGWEHFMLYKNRLDELILRRRL